MDNRCAGTVYVVDDNRAVRDSLTDLFTNAGYRVAVFASAEDFLQRKRWDAPCCLILDVRLHGMNGLELQRTLVRENAAVPVVVLSGHGDIRTAVETIKAGAVDFLEKPFDPRTLLSRVAQAVADTGTEVSKAAPVQQNRLGVLSAREFEVLRFVVEGRTSKEIARTLFLSPRTVETHRVHIMNKLEARSVADLVRIWMESPPREERAPTTG